MTTIHARTEWCPNGCSFTEKLRRVNISQTHAMKGCRFCKRKFTFVRTDTREGRKLRTQLWQQKNGIGLSADAKEKTTPLTGAERTAAWRKKKLKDTEPK